METERGGLPILSFADPATWAAWLAAQPRNTAGLWLKLAKQGNPAPCLTKAEAIDVALCNGWIDGQLNPYDDAWWLVRFTPRKSRSKWSQNNCQRVEQLIAAGRMAPRGLAEVQAAKADGRWEAAYDSQSTASIPADLQNALAGNPEANEFFSTLKGANRYAILFRIQTAKRPETRAKRIAQFIELLQRREKIHS